MSSFCLNNGFRLQKTNRAAKHWKQRPKKPFYHVSLDKILHDSWSISAALARGFSDRHFERGEGPGDEVEEASARYCAVLWQDGSVVLAKPDDDSDDFEHPFKDLRIEG